MVQNLKKIVRIEPSTFGSEVIKIDQISDQSVKEVLLKHFTIGDDATLIGIAQYSDSPQLEFGLHDHKTTDSLISAVGKMKYKGGNTATGRALTFALEQVFNRSSRPDAQKVVLVITDGESLQDSVTEPARRLRENGVEVRFKGQNTVGGKL